MSHRSERKPRSSTAAAAGMLVVLVSLAVFTTWSALTASAAVSGVAAANARTAIYERARFDVLEEESLERKYRLEPGPAVSEAHATVARQLKQSMNRLAATADAKDLAQLRGILELHKSYLADIHELFAAVDAGDSALALKIDDTRVDPVFSTLQADIFSGLDAQVAKTARAVSSLQRAESRLLATTPLTFIVVLFLLVKFLRVSRRYESTVSSRALRDSLTGLPNRECFYDRATLALADEPRRLATTSVLVIDLDRFKELNDTLGHRYGDRLLCLVGPRISPLLRPSDTIARLGGDEFALLLPDAGGSLAAQQVAERVVAALREPFNLEGLTYTIDASCGHASSPDDGANVDDLLQHADVAMYIAKAAHSGVVAYHPTLDINTPRRLAILNELPAAIAEGQLVLHYQPKTDIASGEVTGAEALVRWNHPVHGLVPPDEFIPAAEHSGLIKPLTSWVLNTALAECRRWMDTNGDPGRDDLTVAVNLSARSLLDDTFPAELLEALTRHGVAPGLLSLEVTETAIMSDPQRAHAVLKQLHDLGVELSIDDFGTGYSSLAYLRFLPVSELKIDKSFVKHMREDTNDGVIVRSVIDLAHNLGLKTVAEGIEDQATLVQLTDLGCDVAQGYHLAYPMPAEDLDLWLRTRTDRSFVATPVSTAS
ncbi:MAG: hypothetical protein QOG03_2552 [Actinomycetota bacterium]|nr:hypothetical protein [Actinomycetota bacterium]